MVRLMCPRLAAAGRVDAEALRGESDPAGGRGGKSVRHVVTHAGAASAHCATASKRRSCGCGATP